MSEAVRAAGPRRVLVAELSSFQLRFAEPLRSEVAVLLNLADDHLDWHGDAEAYHRAKARIWLAQRPRTGPWPTSTIPWPPSSGTATRRPASRRDLRRAARRHGRRRARRSARRRPARHTGEVLALDELPPGRAAPPRQRGRRGHARAARRRRVDAVAEAARAFHPGRHRLELVAEADGVRYVDDSKATNVHAAAAALGSAESIVWVAGGLAKGADLAPLGDHLGTVREAVLIGEAAEELARVCAAAGVTSRPAASMEEAVALAAGLARAGDTVLLAPACASFDQFRDYAERGERFAAAARDRRAGAGHDPRRARRRTHPGSVAGAPAAAALGAGGVDARCQRHHDHHRAAGRHRPGDELLRVLRRRRAGRRHLRRVPAPGDVGRRGRDRPSGSPRASTTGSGAAWPGRCSRSRWSG
jgi:UDP-N-acetylmuramoylalanine--D-glutamate ligase